MRGKFYLPEWFLLASFVLLVIFQLKCSFVWWLSKRRYRRACAELTDLYRRRADRVRLALAKDGSDEKPKPAEESYAYTGWVELIDGGKLKVSGQILDSCPTPFSITARDESRIPRAEVIGNGQGVLRIRSHGSCYRAFWEGTKWRVEREHEDASRSVQ